jgi:WD40 repeat protein
MAKSADGSYFITGSHDKTAKLWDIRTLTLLKTYTTERPVNAAAISPLVDHVVIGGGQEASQVTMTSSRAGKFEAKFFHKVSPLFFHRSQLASLVMSMTYDSYSLDRLQIEGSSSCVGLLNKCILPYIRFSWCFSHTAFVVEVPNPRILKECKGIDIHHLVLCLCRFSKRRLVVWRVILDLLMLWLSIPMVEGALPGLSDRYFGLKAYFKIFSLLFIIGKFLRSMLEQRFCW